MGLLVEILVMKCRRPGLILILPVFYFFPLLVRSQTGTLRIGFFIADATPPIGTPVAYAKTRSVTDSLTVRGIVLLSDQQPVVVCAVDWIGIANEGLEVWKEQLAKAAGTTVDRVSVHALHQHDAPRCDFTVEKILQKYGMGGTRFENAFYLKVLQQTALAVKKAVQNAQPVTHIGFGEARVEKVASTRRILGEDGKVAIVRYSSATDPAAIAAPEGVIDPWLKCVSFWNKEKPVVVLTFYATHPQSYYGTGDVTCDFVGIGRNAFEKAIGVPGVHFNGAGGNIAAGKYNDGSPALRPILADRMEAGMKKAWAATQKTRISAKDIAWKSIPVSLPLAHDLVVDELKASMEDEKLTPNEKYDVAIRLAWAERMAAGKKTVVSSLRIGKTWLLNLPGEAFVEYQLAAQTMKPGDQVCTAAYEEYGPRYIGTKIAYTQGGYEVTQSFVSPDVEEVLMNAIREVLK